MSNSVSVDELRKEDTQTPVQPIGRKPIPKEVLEAIEALPPIEKKAMRLRLGLVDGWSRTLPQIGAVIGGLTKERARQIVKQAAERMAWKLPKGMIDDLDLFGRGVRLRRDDLITGPMPVGKKIRQLRRRMGLTAEQLAEKMQMNPGQLKSYEAESRDPSLFVLYKLCRTLGCSLSEFDNCWPEITTTTRFEERHPNRESEWGTYETRTEDAGDNQKSCGRTEPDRTTDQESHARSSRWSENATRTTEPGKSKDD